MNRKILLIAGTTLFCGVLAFFGYCLWSYFGPSNAPEPAVVQDEEILAQTQQEEDTAEETEGREENFRYREPSVVEETENSMTYDNGETITIINGQEYATYDRSGSYEEPKMPEFDFGESYYTGEGDQPAMELPEGVPTRGPGNDLEKYQESGQ